MIWFRKCLTAVKVWQHFSPEELQMPHTHLEALWPSPDQPFCIEKGLNQPLQTRKEVMCLCFINSRVSPQLQYS